MNTRDEMDLWVDEFREKAKSVKESRALQFAWAFVAVCAMAVIYLAVGGAALMNDWVLAGTIFLACVAYAVWPRRGD